MARLFLTSGEITNPLGGANATDNIFGTNSNETVNINGNSKIVFDPSFSRGGDIINVAGNAALYTAKLSGSNIVLTAVNGANIVVPFGTVGATINFTDAARTLYFDTALSTLILGSQTVTAAGVAVTAGSNPGGGGGTGSIISLTVAQDDLSGTANSDTFRARVVQNANGEQTNTLGTGDLINGGAGDADKLLATVQNASPLNGGPGSSILPETTDVEVAHFIALTTYNYGVNPDKYSIQILESNLGVEINAKDMWGLDEVGSVQSDDSLTIYNLTTLRDDGNYATRRLTEEITIRMDHTGNDRAVTPESDLHVYFDQDYLLSQGDVRSGATMTIELMDLDQALGKFGAAGRALPLKDNPFGQIVFTIDGVEHTLTFDTPANHAQTYEELLANVQAALAANPAEFEGLSAAFGGTFTASDTDNDPGGSAQGRTIVITNSGPESLEAVTMRATGDAPAGKDFHTNFRSFEGSDEGFLITSEVVLNKVGRGGQGGDLEIGGMATEGGNSWGEEAGALGVERFNVHVEGDSTQPSNLASMNSTNNQLREIHVDNVAGSTAKLTIGNLNTSYQPSHSYGDDSSVDVSGYKNNAIKDVLIFDASGFANDSEVHAYFSAEAVAKYMDLGDGQTDPAQDNANAVYTFGGGDNVLNVNLNEDNLAVVGTATREDFSFVANMGAGDDHVLMQNGDGLGSRSNENNTSDVLDGFGAVTDANGLQMVENWYYNHVLNQNVTINTGDGDDKVEYWGSSAADINLGDGNDVAFTDNSGETNQLDYEGHAAWVFNSNSPDTPNVDDLQSQPAAVLHHVANLTLTVTYQGIESTVIIADSVGSLTGVDVTDLQINQAIKAAISGHAVLSEVLVAEDGPARTLVVHSQLDGEHAVSDLVITIGSSGPLTTAQHNSTALTLGAVDPLDELDTSALGFNAGGVATGTRFDSEFGWQSGHTLTGYDSVNVNNNNVEGDLGNDIIALSSNGIGLGVAETSTQGNSTETIDINGVFGEDTIFNFTAADDGLGRTIGVPGGESATERGYDIFDVTTVLGAPVSLVTNTQQTDGVEAASIQALIDNEVLLIDTIENDDFVFSSATLNETQKIQEIFRASDLTANAANDPADDMIVITVNADNVGTFYRVHDGLAANDATVTRLGSVELATYDLLGKEEIGNWDGMSYTNFAPLTPEQTTATFGFA